MVPTEGAKSKLSIPIAGVDVFQSEIIDVLQNDLVERCPFLPRGFRPTHTRMIS
jgi:hypothetical protein